MSENMGFDPAMAHADEVATKLDKELSRRRNPADIPMDRVWANAVVASKEAAIRDLYRFKIRELEEALEPFAELDLAIGDEWHEDCERARRLLGKKP